MNIELLVKATALIEEQPHLWARNHWREGDKACLAGHIVILAGGQWRDEHPRDSAVIWAGKIVPLIDLATMLTGIGAEEIRKFPGFFNGNISNLKMTLYRLCCKRQIPIWEVLNKVTQERREIRLEQNMNKASSRHKRNWSFFR